MKFIKVVVLAGVPALSLAQSGHWVGTPPNPGWWVMAETLEPSEDEIGTYTTVRVSGGVPAIEPAYYGLQDMADSSDQYNKYFIFWGDYVVVEDEYEGQTIYYKFVTFGWPGGVLSAEDLTAPNSFSHESDFRSAGCWDYSLNPVPPDSVHLADGFGHWQYDPGPVLSEWTGYMEYVCHAHPWLALPCEPVGDTGEKGVFIFTDSLYNQLPRDILLSGDSRLYFQTTRSGPSGMYAELYLCADPDKDTTVEMSYYQDNMWRGSFTNARTLGLKSFDTLIGRCIEVWSDTIEQFLDSAHVDVALPRIETSEDTVIIRTDSMKIRDDLTACLQFEDDFSGNLISADDRIDSAGYRYSSFWVSNTPCSSCDQDTFNRYYPTDSTYLWWDDSTLSSEVTFWRDSLYVVGGSLSVDCSGALVHIPGINNEFSATTDTVINDTSRATMIILVDGEASDSLISAHLADDIVRAMGWQESNWHNYRNNYPLEHHIYTMTGMMQISRFWWESVFNGTSPNPYLPGYWEGTWDSLSWNWMANVHNGRYIYYTDTFYRMQPYQREWPYYYFPQDDYTPDDPNQEDLAVFGYHDGVGAMQSITRDNWKAIVTNNDHIVAVRRNKDTRPWE